jgi:hypothetical protein
MAWLQHFKAEPTDYILAYSNGKVFRQGPGKAFWYWRHKTSIVLVPVSTKDALFVLNEGTNNFQTVTLQGQITYRVVEPETVAGLLNFTIDPRTKQYLTEDPEKLSQRIINIVQTLTRKELQNLSLEDALRSAERLAQSVLGQIQQENMLATMGIACMSLFFTSIKATPEMSKALEAEYREALQKRADQAIYSRRADAVEQERKIKQNELSTSIDLEQRRQDLVNLQGENTRKQAEFDAEAVRIQLVPFQAFDPRLLLALGIRDLAGNAQKIGNLTITSEILEQLLNGRIENGK